MTLAGEDHNDFFLDLSSIPEYLLTLVAIDFKIHRLWREQSITVIHKLQRYVILPINIKTKSSNFDLKLSIPL